MTFSGSVRAGISAVALGLMTATGAAVMTAPAAEAQTKEFVDADAAAKTAYEGRKYADAVAKLDTAATHAKSTKEKVAVADMRIGCYSALRRYSDLIKAIEARQALGGVSAA